MRGGMASRVSNTPPLPPPRSARRHLGCVHQNLNNFESMTIKFVLVCISETHYFWVSGFFAIVYELTCSAWCISDIKLHVLSSYCATFQEAHWHAQSDQVPALGRRMQDQWTQQLNYHARTKIITPCLREGLAYYHAPIQAKQFSLPLGLGV